MIREENKTYHYHAIVDKDNNVLYKYPSKKYAITYAKKHPNAVAIKEVDHIITEKVVWKRDE